ncbi:MAG: endolytic transglycosylase MltG [Acinetobacter sp.]|nr:endolytic transglycosylase MltG [Acinetobacter sp.]
MAKSSSAKKATKKRSSKKANSNMPMWKKLTLGLGVFAGLGVAVAAYIGYSNLAQPYKSNAEKTISIKHGDSYSRFIDRIAKEQQVAMPVVLKIYQKFFIQDSLKAGIYEVKDGMSIKDVLQLVSDSNNVQLNRIVVVEGTTFKQLIQTLKKDPLVKKTVVDLPTEQLLKTLNITETHPEGLFAPDTYFFEKGETDQRILLDLYQRQKKVLDDEWQKRDSDLPYKTPYEALIMASIIDKETNVDSELAQVSGVFYRRLKIGMKLQTDPTVIYGMGDRYNGNITKADLRTPTAYNTYTINGLPPTPISLPSKRAIHAALHPDKNSKAIFFVATGKGGHKFSETLEQHDQAVAEYLQVLKDREKK